MKHAFLCLSLGMALFLQAGGEAELLRSAPVPNRMLRQGDAHMIKGDGTFGVRIDLHTRHLKRVQEKILDSEIQNWPEEPGSERYREALDSATAPLLDQKGKQSFRIDWILYADGSGTVALGNDNHRILLENLPRDYLKANLLLILQDRFDLSPEEAEAELLRHLP